MIYDLRKHDVMIVDTREKPQAIESILEYLQSKNIDVVLHKLDYGDYQLIGNNRIIIDRKQNLQELIGNVTHDHERFMREVHRANDSGCKLIVLVEHSNRIKSIDDVEHWINPRLKLNRKATSGKTLAKILRTIEANYEVGFMFCDKAHTGQKIMEILKGG